MKFHERIQKIQEALNLSQNELSERTGISIKSIRNWYYRGSIPRGDSLEILLRKIPEININFLMLEQDSPLLQNASELPPKKNFSKETDEDFREVSYRYFVFLFENAKSPKLHHDMYRFVKAEGFVGKTEKRLGFIVGSGYDLLTKALQLTPFDILSEFYTKHLYAIVRDIAMHKTLDPIDAYILCRIGRMTSDELNTFDKILCPPDDIDEFRGKIDTIDKFLLWLFEEKKLSGSIVKTNNIYKFIQIAYRQLAQSLRNNHFPNYCSIHEKLHWTLVCPECSKK